MILEQLSGFANHLWQSTLFAAMAGFLTLFLAANRAEVRYFVWLSASVKFLIPFSILAAVGSVVSRHIAVATVSPQFDTATGLSSAFERVGVPFTTAPVSHLTITTVQPSNTSQIATILFVVWAIGFVTLICRWALRWRRVQALVRSASPLRLPISIPAKSSPAFGEPAVFGILRPTLLMPEGITDSLTAPEMQTILVHELCHVRRCDNLVAAIHMVVEAAFWFYPPVWWLGTRLVEERERACDEEVLRTGVEPRTYAEAILKTCELYLASPLAYLAGVAGGDLERRIQAILSDRPALRLSPAKKATLAMAGLAALAAPVTIGIIQAPSVRAQEPPRKQIPVPVAGPARPYVGPEFTVAAVRRNGVGPHSPPNTLDLLVLKGFQNFRPGLFEVKNVTLSLLIQLAYDLDTYQIVDGPAWTNSDRFDVVAKAEGDASLDLMRLMVRSLLADRFKLTLRRDTREAPVYNLAVASGGVKIKATDEGSCVALDLNRPAGPIDPLHPPPLPCGGLRRQIVSISPARRDRIDAVGISMSKLIEIISSDVGAFVANTTGFTQKFGFQLEFLPREGLSNGLGLGLGPPAPGEPGAGLPIAAALQQQLGLRLESAKAFQQVLVVDHVERPSEN